MDAAMNESDGDDGDDGSVHDGERSANASEDEGSWTDESNSIIRSVDAMIPRIYAADVHCSSTTSSPRISRKRLRSLTPSESGINGLTDAPRSPLAKRKKLAAERSGASKLKEEIVAPEQEEEDAPSPRPVPPTSEEMDDEDESSTESDGDSDGAMDEDDFLARELEDDWT